MNVINRHPLTTYFIFAFLFSWLITLMMVLRYNGVIDVPGWLHYLVAWGPAAAALLITGITEGHEGLRQLMGRLFHWRIGWEGWLLAVGSPLLFLGIGVLISRVTSGIMPDLGLLGQVDYLGNIGIPMALLVWILSFGIGEEIGWRGFAQHHLEPKRGFLFTVMVIGLLWACWHIPHFFYKDTYIAMGLAGFPFFVVNLIPGAIVLGWLYSRTHSILAVALWHGLFDFGTASALDQGTVAIVMSVLVMAWALVIVIGKLRTKSSQRKARGLAAAGMNSDTQSI